MANKQHNFKNVFLFRKIILIFVGLVTIGLVVSSGIYIFGSSNPEPVSGKEYTILDNSEQSLGARISVREFFSYACIHCSNLNKILPGWEANLKRDVNFILEPLPTSTSWTALAQAYYGLQSLGMLERKHDSLFDAIHNKRINLATIPAIGKWLGGAEGSKFITAANSLETKDKVRNTRRLAAKYRIRSVPTFIVAGKYKIESGRIGQRRTLEVINELIAMERQARTEKLSLPTQKTK